MSCGGAQTGVHPTNAHVAQVLKWLGQYVGLAEKGTKTLRFKQSAYRNAAESILALDSELTTAHLEDMPGVGEKLRAKIDQILSTGTCDELESLIAQYGDLRELMEIGGVGPVTARDLYVTHGCRTVEDVRRLVDSSVVTNKAIIASLAMIGRRIPRADAQPVADKIAAAFDDLVAKGHRFDFCGSWRRQRSDIKDFDVLTDAPHAAVRAVVSQFGPLAEDGESKMGVVVDGIKLEVRFVTPPQYGSAMLHLTGSWQFNARMRAVAKSKGYKLNEYGLFDATDKCITSESEEAIFKALGMDFVVPIGRE